MPEIDYEATYKLEDSGFDGSTVALMTTPPNENGAVAIYVHDPIMNAQTLLEEVTRCLMMRGYIRLAFIARDVEMGLPPRANVFATATVCVRSLTVHEIGG